MEIDPNRRWLLDRRDVLGRFALSLLSVLALAATARADEAPRAPQDDAPPARALDPEVVHGVARPAHEPGDFGRDVTSVLTFLPRKAVDALFLATGTAAGLVRDEQVVPRVEELLSPRPGEITLVPAIFFDTRRAPSVGALVLARGDLAATSLTVGFGGVHDANLETRARFGTANPLPLVLDTEVLFDSRSALDYLGVGQDPVNDPRNRFQEGRVGAASQYMERRARLLASLGVRPHRDVELFLSSGFNQSVVEDTPGSARAIGQVFVPGSIERAPGRTRYVYNELALRLDTRPTLGRPSPGVLIESYFGSGFGVTGDDTHFFRVGGRAALFAPIRKRTTIFSPRVTLDGVFAAPGAALPFTALAGQPDFRGFDTRRDQVSVVASIDYRWMVTTFLSARLFLDAADVGPNLSEVLKNAPRFAAGAGFDLFTSSAEIGQIAIAGSGDGARLVLTFGVPSAFGDRQHRN